MNSPRAKAHGFSVNEILERPYRICALKNAVFRPRKYKITGFILLLGIIFSLSLAYAENQFIAVKGVDGYVEIMRAKETSWQPATPGAPLFSNDKIRTRLESRAVLEYPDGTTLSLRENTQLTIQDISRDTKTSLTKRELKLNVGGMKYKVTKLEEKGSEFKIHSSTAIVGVTGTEGIITAEGDKKPTQNILLEGSTYNTDETGAGGRPLAAGNSWSIDEQGKSDKQMNTSTENIENEYTEPDKALTERFNRFIASFNQKKSEGYLVNEAILENITQAMLAKDYAKAAGLLTSAEKLLENLKKPQDKKAGEINEIIKSLNNEFMEKEKQGYDLSELYLLYNKINELYQSQNYDPIPDLIEQIRHKLLTLTKAEGSFSDELNRLTEEINQKAKAGFIVTEVIDLAKRAEIAFRNGLFAQAEELLSKARAMLAQTRQDAPPELLNGLQKLQEDILVKKKEGFAVAGLEELLAEPEKLVKENKYVEAGQILQKIHDSLGALKKSLPEDLAYLLKNFEEAFKKREAAGYDLSSLQDLMKSALDTKDTGDFEKLRSLLSDASAQLAKLGLPEGLALRLKEIRERLTANSAFAPAEIENILQQIQSALDKEDLRQLRLSLDNAQKLLDSLKDTEPPSLQVSDPNYKESSVVISGIAKDNIALDYVTVNECIVTAGENGYFTHKLFLTPLLKEIAIKARDKEGNLSPEIKITIPEEKLPKEIETPALELNAQDIKLTYTEDGILITGKASAGAIVTANNLTVSADSAGEFSFSLVGSQELITNGITLSAKDNSENASPEIKLNVEDKWLPQLNNVDIRLYDNMPPVLKTEDLSYVKDTVTVKGTCIDTANITVEGEVRDIGSGIKEITVNGQAVMPEAEKFKTTLLLTPELKSIEIKVTDLAANASSLMRVNDLFLLPPVVKINEKQVTQDAAGNFSSIFPLNAELKEIIIQAKDALGNEATPLKLIVADRIAPQIILGDIFYETNSVSITGQTKPHASVYDKTQSLFQDKIPADAAGLFRISFSRPKNTATLKLVAEDLSGNLSEEVNLTIEALKDEKPPLLTVANLNFQANKVIVSGKAEDDTGIKSLTINGENAELTDGIFSKELMLSPELTKIIILATDLSEKTTTVEKIITDDVKPEITLNELSYKDGFCVVKGEARDNLGLKEVRVNNVPVSISLPAGGAFEYQLPINAELKEITAVAIDLYGNYQEAANKEIKLPPDNIAPSLTLNELTYGSPKAIVSGQVSDNVGLKNILVNNEPVNFYEDGAFKTVLDIKISPPVIILNDPIYSEGYVLVSGKINPSVQEPAEITAIAEDLSGNKSMLFKRQVNALDLSKFRVLVNGSPAGLENDTFKTKVILEKGLSEIKVQAFDSLDNASDISTVPLERVPPLLTLEEPVYGTDAVTISGKAQDSGCGLSEILINNVAAPFDSEGKFSKTLALAESVISVMALDRLGNAASGAPIKISPPDKYPPLFILKVNPVPAVIGKDVAINIDVLDTKTRLPEILKNPPELNAVLANGENKNIEASGAGASFNALLPTTGLPAGIINLSVKGTDNAGNTGDKSEGTASFLLNTTDTTPPSFTVTLTPPAPAIAGKEVKVNIIASETLKTSPKATVTLPGGMNFEFNDKISIPASTPPGEAAIQLSGAVDLAGNAQTTPAVYNFIVETEKIKSAVPLRIEFSEITPERIIIKGATAAGAIVRISLADIKADLAADNNGIFAFLRDISSPDLERWRKTGPSVLLQCYATNYAGLSSEKINLNILLPSAAAVSAGKNFTIEVTPYPLEQGQAAQLNITTVANLKEMPKASIRLNDGKIEFINISGSGKEFKGIYQSNKTTAVGPAMIEVKGDGLFETKPFRIAPSSENYAYMAGAGFFMLRVNPDPLPQGKELDISVSTQRPISNTPTLNIRLPNGKMENIALAGQGSEFRGKYLCPKDMPLGPAELIVNMGERNELRRPFGIAPPGGMRFGDFIRSGDIVAFSNPMPIAAGSSATINVKSGKQLEELPQAGLRLSNGQIISLVLSGAVPGNNFSGQVNIPKDTPFGPAAIVIKDKAGNTLGEYPSGISPSFISMPGEVEAFLSPSPTQPGQTVNLNVNSGRRPLTFIPNAKLIFTDGTVLPIKLEGSLPANNLRAQVAIPKTAPSGTVNIMLSDPSGLPIGGGQGYISGAGGATGTSGEARISLMPPHPMPGAPFEVSLYSDTPLRFMPKFILDIPGKGPKDLRAEGVVPGNNFRAQTTFPADARPSGAKVEVRFDRGAGEETRVLFLEGAGSEAGLRPPKLTPFPPVVGQPLIITLYSPGIIDFIPTVRVNYSTGAGEPVTMSGALPGDTFNGTLPKVSMPVKSVDIFDVKGGMIVSLPVDMFGGMGMTGAAPQIQVMPMPLMPGMIANLNLNFPMPVFSVPSASIKLVDGKVIPVILNGPVPGNNFSGIFNLAPGTPSGQAMLEVYLDNQIIPGGRMPVYIGTETTGTTGNDILMLMVYPGAPGELILDWQLPLPDIAKHRITYEASGIARKTIDLGRMNHYMLTSLTPNLDYTIVLSAFDNAGKELGRSQRVSRTANMTTTSGFPLYISPSGPGSLQVNWDYQQNAVGYELRYGKDIDPRTQPAMKLGNVTGYFLSGLASGNYRFIVEAVLSTGERISSQEVPAYIGTADFGRPMIELFPAMPIIGQPLDINVMLPMMVYGTPKVTAKYLTQGEEPIAVTGTIPGSAFRGRLALAKDQVTSINLYDPLTGELRYSYPVGTVSMSGIPSDLRVKITVSPEPPVVGSNLNINLDFNQSIDFYQLGLHAYAELTSGTRIDLAVTGAAPTMNYKALLSASQHTSAVRVIGVEGSGIIPDEYINTQLTGGRKAVIMTMPDQPQIGTYTQIKVSIIDANTGQASALTTYPKINAEFANGEIRLLTVNGALPGSEFGAEILAANFTSSLRLIDVIDSNGALLGTKSFSTTAVLLTDGVIDIIPFPPQLGPPLTINYIKQTSLSALPYIRIQFADGTNQEFIMTGNIPGLNFSYIFSSLLKIPQHLEVWDNGRVNKLAERHIDPSASASLTGWFLTTDPAPPQFGQTLAVTLTNTSQLMLSALPYLRLYFDDGTAPEYLMAGALPGSNFTYTLSALSKLPQRVEVWDNAKANKLFELFPGAGAMPYPINLRDEAAGIATERKILWDIVPNAPGYDIYAGFNNPPSTKWKEVFSNLGAEIISGLTSGQTYYYYVTVRGATTYETVKSFVAGGGTSSGSGNLKITSPASGGSGFATAAFNNTNAGSTTNSITVSVQNTGSATSNAKVTKNPLSDGTNTIPLSNINFVDSISVAGGTTVSQTISITIPAGTAAGNYLGRLTIYDDLNSSGTQDSGESEVKLDLQVTVGTPAAGINIIQGGANFGSVNPGNSSSTQTINVQNSGGTTLINVRSSLPVLNKTGGGGNIPSANIFFNLKSTVSGALGASETTTSTLYVKVPAGQLTGTYEGIMTVYNDANFNGTKDSDEPSDTLPITIQVVAFTSPDTTAPTFAGIKRAYANGVSGQVQIEFNPASDATTPISYLLYRDTTAAGVFSSAPTNIGSVTSYTVTGLTNGTTYYFGVRAQDNAATPNINTNTTTESAKPYTSVNHITISSAASGTVGTPVLVKLTAYSSIDDSTINTSFADAVKVNVTESAAAGTQPKYIISSQDRVTRDTAEVAMTSGVGYFTIDAVESTTVSINVSGISSNTQTIAFTGSSGSIASQIALDCDSAAKTGTTTTDGVLIWVSIVNTSGKVVTGYTGTINISLTGSGSRALSVKQGTTGNLSGAAPSYTYAYTAADNGEVVFRLTDDTAESVTVNALASGLTSGTKSITFSGVQKYIIESGGQYTINATTTGNRIKFIAYAATNAGIKIGGYSGTANWLRVSETTSNNSSQAIPSTITFTDGQAEFHVEDSEYETVTFKIADSTDGNINSGDINATFVSVDPTPPDIRSAIAETPFLIHLYFTEEIDSTNALKTTNYTGVGAINKVCWYGNEVTVHLAAQLALGSASSITVNGVSPDGIKDTNGNFMGTKTPGFTVPNVDYQGTANSGTDWLEIQVSPSSVPAGSNQNVTVIVRHKNACGYLSGSNAVNRATNVPSADFTYGGAGTIVSGGAASRTMSDGTIEFTLTVNLTAGQNVTVQASAAGVTSSGTATISPQ